MGAVTFFEREFFELREERQEIRWKLFHQSGISFFFIPFLYPISLIFRPQRRCRRLMMVWERAPQRRRWRISLLSLSSTCLRCSHFKSRGDLFCFLKYAQRPTSKPRRQRWPIFSPNNRERPITFSKVWTPQNMLTKSSSGGGEGEFLNIIKKGPVYWSSWSVLVVVLVLF